METFLRPHIYNRIRILYISSRQFSFRSDREYIGMGMNKRIMQNQQDNSKVGVEQTSDNNDLNMQRHWKQTFARIASLQNKSNTLDAQNKSNETGQANQQKSDTTTSNATNNKATLLGFGKLSTKETGKINNPFSIDEQSRMKLSFAEGYMYGGQRKHSRMRVLIYVLNIGLFGFIGYILYKSSGLRSFGSSRNYEIAPEEIDVTFADVKGCDESKQELSDIVDFLRNPAKYSKIGGKLPKGVLLVGPPGTGKTLLAKAIAGEAKVPFFHASGSEFDEILVGQGAKRIRKLFEHAKKRSPCLIFIDEIDSVGGKRSNSGLHPYANQTINQLLSEMDGFSSSDGVIVIGATNRESHLDSALVRPGRFDIKVSVNPPDSKGRRELFEYYLGKVKAATNINLDTLCRTTIGLTGADIENIVNQAALRSAKEGLGEVFHDALEFAMDKVLMGPERKNKIPDHETNLMTAYHEGGHALTAMFTKRSYNLHKVTIISRTNSLGHTSTVPEKDLYGLTKDQYEAEIDVMLGGRVAEELAFGLDKVTSGCSDDLRKATEMATIMVKRLGMSDKIGLRVIAKDDHECSNKTSELADEEIKRILEVSCLKLDC